MYKAKLIKKKKKKIGGLGCKQQDILLSSFIKRVYAEIEKTQHIQQYTPKAPPKKSMSTPEAISELKTLCIEQDPCLIYTDMVKVGEG